MITILKEKLDSINNNKNLKTPVYSFLCTYYDEYIDEMDPSENAPFPEELTKPIEDRESGIAEAMKLLVENHYNLDEGDCFNPLMMAVGHADAPMTEFLIANGADAHYWPDMDEPIEKYSGNYYLEDIDIAYFNERWPIDDRYINALLQTAKVLLRDGHTDSFFGLCLNADAEKREITLSAVEWKY